MPLDAPLRSVSQKVIDKFGQSVTLRIVTAGSYDPSTRTASNTDADQTVNGIITKPSLGASQFSEAGAVRLGDRQVTIPAKNLTTVPDTSSLVVIDSKEYEVVEVNPVYSGDEVAIYELLVRR